MTEESTPPMTEESTPPMTEESTPPMTEESTPPMTEESTPETTTEEPPFRMPSLVLNDDDNDFGDQFAALENLVVPDEEVVPVDPEKSDEETDEVEDGFNAAASEISTELQSRKGSARPLFAQDDSMMNLSTEKNNFGDQMADLGGIRAKPNMRQSFSKQIQSINEIDAESITSASDQIDHKFRRASLGKSLASLFGLSNLEDLIDDDHEESIENDVPIAYDNHVTDPVFDSRFEPDSMRCLALVAHNHMKPAMKTFVLANKNLLCKFKLTGTNTTMTMLREVFGDNESVKYGPTCTSGPLGGDAELVAIMCTENLGGCIFFQDPMSAHPHQADIECLSRQANVHNVLMMPNPATAYACMESMRIALKDGRAEIIPSFFKTLQSPSVAEYITRQARVVKRNANKK